MLSPTQVTRVTPFSSAAAATTPRARTSDNTTAKPNPKAAKLYDTQYQKYASLYPALKPNFPTLCG